MEKICHICHMGMKMSLDNAQILHDFWHEFCHCGQICYISHNENVSHHQNSQPQTERVQLDLQIVLKLNIFLTDSNDLIKARNYDSVN